MSKISKVNAFKTMVEYVDSDNYGAANEVFKIINRSQNNDKKNNIISKYIKLRGKKEERLFKAEFIIIEENEEQED